MKKLLKTISDQELNEISIELEKELSRRMKRAEGYSPNGSARYEVTINNKTIRLDEDEFKKFKQTQMQLKEKFEVKYPDGYKRSYEFYAKK